MSRIVSIVLLVSVLANAALADEDPLIRRLGDLPNEVEEWSPGTLDFDPAAERIDQLRERARAREQQDRLSSDDGAVALWLALLNQAPQDPEALAALDRLRERWIARIAQLFDQGAQQPLRNERQALAQLSEVEALAPARLAAERASNWLDRRPEITKVTTSQQWRDAHRTLADLADEVGDPAWLTQDQASLQQQLVELWQTQRNPDQPQAGLDWIVLAEERAITLPDQQGFLTELEARQQQTELAAIEALIENQDFDRATQRLSALPDGLPERQALQRTLDKRQRLAALKVGEPVSPSDDPRLPDMVYVGPLADQGTHLLVAQHEISVAQYRAFAETTGRTGRNISRRFDLRDGEQRPTEEDWRTDYIGDTAEEQQPVIHVSWDDAVAYSEWLASISGQEFRLPSAAEYERYAGGDVGMRYWWGNTVPASAVENLAGEHDRSPRRQRHPDAFVGYGDEAFGPTTVARYRPNQLGLYDIIGNVAEWTLDCAGAAQENCRGRLVKGGHWRSTPTESQISHQRAHPGDQADNTIGFRVVMVFSESLAQ